MNIKKITTNDLMKELARRERSAEKLQGKRADLMAQLAEVDSELGALGESPRAATRSPVGRPAGRRRPRNELSLADAIAAAMEVRAEVTPKEAGELVRANGYKSGAKNFGMMVSNALAKDKRFKRISRGLYQRVS